jgi:(p)ppGpp synthase/HD superfamily hydrolase
MSTSKALVLGPRFEEALALATSLHRHHYRKGTGVPYLSHLLAVASLALEHGASEDEAIAALLHDAVEDVGIETIEDIRGRFGDAVAEIVLGCTDSQEEPKPPWRQRKEAYLLHIRSAPASVRLVSNADKLHNARCILRDYRSCGEELWERFRGGREGVFWYYGELAATFAELGSTPGLADELARTVHELRELAGVTAPATATPR